MTVPGSKPLQARSEPMKQATTVELMKLEFDYYIRSFISALVHCTV